MLDLALIQKLEHQKAKVPIVKLCFGISLYTEKPLSAFPKAVIKAFTRFNSIVGEESLCFYATETMSKHKAVTPRAREMLKDWFGPAAPANESYGIEYHNGAAFNAAPSIKFEVSGTEAVDGERAETATLIRMSLPAEWGTAKSAQALELTTELCELLPFRSGSAGFAFEYSRYYEEEALDHAISSSMRHPGIDIHDSVNDCHAVDFDGVRGVGWLTILDSKFMKQLGKLPKLKHCEVIPIKAGAIIKAGPAPAIGDVNRKDNLPAYREAFKLVQPLTEVAIERSPWFDIDTDAEERTMAWLKRFSEHG